MHLRPKVKRTPALRRESLHMSTAKPKTRTEAGAPEETQHLTPGQQESMEAGAEVEHSTGQRREDLTAEAEKAALEEET